MKRYVTGALIDIAAGFRVVGGFAVLMVALAGFIATSPLWIPFALWMFCFREGNEDA